MLKKILVRLSIFLSIFFVYQLFWIFSLNYNKGKLKKISTDGSVFRSNMFYCKNVYFEEKQFKTLTI